MSIYLVVERVQRIGSPTSTHLDKPLQYSNTTTSSVSQACAQRELTAVVEYIHILELYTQVYLVA